MKQIEVRIMGQGYLLSCPDNGEAHLLDAVSRVDMGMCRIRDAGKVKALDRIAVLAAINLAFELSEARSRHQLELTQAQARHQLELDQVKLELAQARHNLAALTTTLNTLNSQPASPPPLTADHLTEETEAQLAVLMQRVGNALCAPSVQAEGDAESSTGQTTDTPETAPLPADTQQAAQEPAVFETATV